MKKTLVFKMNALTVALSVCCWIISGVELGVGLMAAITRILPAAGLFQYAAAFMVLGFVPWTLGIRRMTAEQIRTLHPSRTVRI